MPASSPPGTAGYAETAATLAQQYESITFEQVHSDALHLIPAVPCLILDIGAGTGRDAAALAKQGHTVTAAEPTAELRTEGMQIHADIPPSRSGGSLRWIDDALPDLPVLSAEDKRYDLLFLTAVWMHLPEVDRRRAMSRIAALLAPHGRIIMSLRHGPVPAGRTMYDVSGEETITLAAANGLSCILQTQRQDMLGREGVRWTFLCFELGREGNKDASGGQRG